MYKKGKCAAMCLFDKTARYKKVFITKRQARDVYTKMQTRVTYGVRYKTLFMHH